MERALTRHTASSTTKELCCDICSPALFDQVRCLAVLCGKLFMWRLETKKRSYSHASFSAAALLSNELCEMISSVSAITCQDDLRQLLEPSWGRWNELGPSLWLHISESRSQAPGLGAGQQAEPSVEPHDTVTPLESDSSVPVKRVQPSSRFPAAGTTSKARTASTRAKDPKVTQYIRAAPAPCCS